LEPLQFAYNLILNTLGYGALPYLLSGSAKDPAFRKGRMGRYEPDPLPRSSPRVWFHAASVGEVTGAIPILRALQNRLPNGAIFLTVGTPQGLRHALRQMPEGTVALPFPLDFDWALKRAFKYIRPDLYVALEGEFWPNLFRILHSRRIPTILLNGRLSSRSAGRYRFLKPLFQPIFKHFTYLAMHSEEDMRNALSVGAPPDRTLVLGSSKYDGLKTKVDPRKAAQWRELLDIPSKIPVAIGGSLRKSECTQLFEVFLPLLYTEPRPVGIFVPRHLEQIPNMVEWLQSRGIPYHLLSNIEAGREKREHPVVLVDRIGILFELYGIGDLIFCGGTLEPIGGHNILEPAAWEKPVFYGPHLQKVFYEHTILQALGGSFAVKDAGDLSDQWSYWIHRLPELSRHGEKAGEALQKLGGVAARQVDLIMDSLQNNKNLWKASVISQS
jgi:3-deoxy-D-manno-octulosonic-acid transferase